MHKLHSWEELKRQENMCLVPMTSTPSNNSDDTMVVPVLDIQSSVVATQNTNTLLESPQ